MFDSLTTKHKIILATLGFLLLTIPISAFIISYRLRATVDSKANSDLSVQDLSIKPIVDNPTPEKTLLDQLKEDLASPTPTPEQQDSSTEKTTADSAVEEGGTTLNLGPMLTFNIKKESVAKDRQAEPKIFVGIATGQATKNPQYLLSFTVEVVADGSPKEDLSIAGLTVGDTYTAYIKSQTSLTASTTFSAKPTTTNLGTVNLLVGDINEDNLIDQKDRDILMKAYGSRPGSTNWNEIADFNWDQVINAADLAYITKNMNKDGASGVWRSTPTSTATPSASPSGGGPKPSDVGGPRDIEPIRGNGYWMWVPSTKSN